jgi:hypothetical protein
VELVAEVRAEQASSNSPMQPRSPSKAVNTSTMRAMTLSEFRTMLSSDEEYVDLDAEEAWQCHVELVAEVRAEQASSNSSMQPMQAMNSSDESTVAALQAQLTTNAKETHDSPQEHQPRVSTSLCDDQEEYDEAMLFMLHDGEEKFDDEEEVDESECREEYLAMAAPQAQFAGKVQSAHDGLREDQPACNSSQRDGQGEALAERALQVKDVEAEIWQEYLASFYTVRTQVARTVQTTFGDLHEDQYEGRTSSQDGLELEELDSESHDD